MAISPIQPDFESPSPNKLTGVVKSIRNLSAFRYSRFARQLVTVTAAHSVATEDERIILADATGGAFNVTLPEAANADVTEYVVKKTDVSGNAVTVATPGAETIDGAATFVLAAQWDAVRLASDGTNYFATGSYP